MKERQEDREPFEEGGRVGLHQEPQGLDPQSSVQHLQDKEGWRGVGRSASCEGRGGVPVVGIVDPWPQMYPSEAMCLFAQFYLMHSQKSELGMPGQGGPSVSIDCIDYVTGIGNAHSIYWQSVFRLRAPSTDTSCSHPDAFVMLSGTSAVLCNVLTPSREVWRAKSTPFLLPHPLLGRYP